MLDETTLRAVVREELRAEWDARERRDKRRREARAAAFAAGALLGICAVLFLPDAGSLREQAPGMFSMMLLAFPIVVGLLGASFAGDLVDHLFKRRA